jgi:hypothetical protein
MRTLRLPLAGTVMLALLGGLGGAVLAQSDEEESSGTATYIDGQRRWIPDPGYELVMSDPRASGTYSELSRTVAGDAYDGDSARPSFVGLIEVTLVNAEGSWAGLQSALWDDEMGWRLTAWLAGEGAHEGLTLYLHAHRSAYSEQNMDFDGIIFEVEPPVMLEAVQIPTE